MSISASSGWLSDDRMVMGPNPKAKLIAGTNNKTEPSARAINLPMLTPVFSNSMSTAVSSN
jgi:hypothetical protein